MQTRIEPTRILYMKGYRFLRKADELLLKEKVKDKLITEIIMLINIENFFLQKFCGGEFYPRFRKLLNNAIINTNQANNKPNKPI